MASSKKIKTRIKSIQSTHQITKAMEIVSTTKFRRYSLLAKESQAFSDSIQKILTNISMGVKAEKHPLFDGRERVRNIGVIVVTSDRGLCGSFNSSTLKELEKFRKKHDDQHIFIIPVGKKGRDYCEKRGYNVIQDYVGVDNYNMLTITEEISKVIVDRYQEEKLDEVYIIYNKFISALRSDLTLSKVIPITRLEGEENRGYIFEPSAEEVLSSLLPRYIGVTVYQAVLNNTASEHSARKNAMKNANENAEDMIRQLDLKYNRERQAAITQEITEIVGGAEAL
ncbi:MULTISPECIES: ATP synthase F1 subunit gamma [Fusobacterium]|uniref:ATP synthase gamma chain n=1 Tax=Fusobacterium equinum TaxID=134605 RepID=A0A133NBJ8_9FUSO|nr:MULTISPECIES: ATP synthase F1 subunit gamma [Fusobacterium]AVQ16126.1 ATP synthase F1 subunit gamma [Fusobacterium gonidiaformans ATCC 25563]EFS28651.1 ATP synthase F1, gamma subunit [Fusobacterium gonidiaformans ATCC 25563]KXA13642.1 ATP synthase F1, gamma subunit [Fusobacterium equinum]